MSRIADAMMRGADPNHRPLPAPSPEYIDQDLSASAPLAWDLEETPRHVDPAPVALAAVETPRVAEEPRPELVELVERLFEPASGRPARTAVTFASLGRSRVRHPLTLDIARTLASYDAGTVCVVDASGGVAALHEAADANAGPGLSDALGLGRPAAAMAIPIGDRLWMVTAGHEPRDPAAAFLENVPGAVRELARHFDFLIIEAPPLENDAAIAALLALAPGTDGIVLGLDRDRTRRDRTSGIVSRLRTAGLVILGAVLVDDPSVPPGPVAGRRSS